MFKLLGAIIMSALMLGGCGGEDSTTAGKTYHDSYGNEIKKEDVDLVNKSIEIEEYYKETLVKVVDHIQNDGSISELTGFANEVNKNRETLMQELNELYTYKVGDEPKVSEDCETLGVKTSSLLDDLQILSERIINGETEDSIVSMMEFSLEFTYPSYEEVLENIDWVETQEN